MKRIKTAYLYNRWFESIVSQRKLLGRFGDIMPELYYDLVWRDGERIALAGDCAADGYGDTYEDMLRLVREKKSLMLFPAYYNGRYIYLFNYRDGQYFLAGKNRTAEECIEFCRKLQYEYVLMEELGDCDELKEKSGYFRNIVNVVLLNNIDEKKCFAEITDAFLTHTEHDPKVCNPINIEDGTVMFENEQCSIEGWEDIREQLKCIAEYIAVFELLQIKFVITGSGIKLWKVSPYAEIPASYEPGEKTAAFINEREKGFAEPGEQYALKLKEQEEFNRKWEKAVEERHRSGMRPFMASFWENELEKDMADKCSSDDEKTWAHQRGFFGYRVKEIGLSEENYRNYVPDYDYFWVNRINNPYQIWIEDKLASRYVLDSISEFLPDYYYCVNKINGTERIIPLMDLPEGMGCTYDDVLALLKVKKKLAVKRSYATHGDGFNVIEYKFFGYYLNGKRTKPEALIAEIFAEEANYLITEYVKAHKSIRRFWPAALNTVRVNVMQETGSEPVIGACFMRIGHSKGGYTDNLNTDSGGIAVSVDKYDGTVLDPEFRKGTSYEECPVHPDTGVPIEGVVPHWDQIRKGVSDVCRKLPQLQYFGFDIAVTDDSFKIIEINVFPDYLKYLMLDDDMQDFIRRKVISKFRQNYLELPEIYRDEPSASSEEKSRFKISVIMPVYNLEKYLREAVDSVTGQTMAFKENIQIIFIDDGSTDSSAEICKEYKERFPDNIIYVYQDNAGVSAARNAGLEYVQGEYVTFLDGDDRWNSSAFARVWDFISAHGKDGGVIACRRKWFEGSKGYAGNDFRFIKGSRVIDINEEPECFHVDVCSSFMRADKAAAIRFDENLTLGEDSLYVNRLILDDGRYGVVKEAVYNIRRRRDGTSITQCVYNGEDKTIYTDTVKQYYEYMYDYSEKQLGEVIPFVQYLIMDAVRFRLGSSASEALDEADKAEYIDRLVALCRRSDKRVLLSLKNGSIGGKANVMRMAYPEIYANELELDGESVFISGVKIGEINVRGALTVTSEEFDSEGVLHIEGNVLLPSFVEQPEIFISPDGGKTAAVYLEMTEIPGGGYTAVDGKPFYDRYSLKADISTAEEYGAEWASGVYLSTDTEPVRMAVNRRKKI